MNSHRSAKSRLTAWVLVLSVPVLYVLTFPLVLCAVSSSLPRSRAISSHVPKWFPVYKKPYNWIKSTPLRPVLDGYTSWWIEVLEPDRSMGR